MNITILKPTEVNVKYIRINAKDEHPEDVITINMQVELETGKIVSGLICSDGNAYEYGSISAQDTYNVFAKVVDCGYYALLDANGNIVAEKFGDYVPNDIIPGEWGDYIEIDVAAGYITNWPKISAKDIIKSFDLQTPEV